MLSSRLSRLAHHRRGGPCHSGRTSVYMRLWRATPRPGAPEAISFLVTRAHIIAGDIAHALAHAQSVALPHPAAKVDGPSIIQYL